MTGRIFDVKRFAVHDGDGIRTTVFFKGYPLKRKCDITRKEFRFFLRLDTSKKCIGCGECEKTCTAHRFVNDCHEFYREHVL